MTMSEISHASQPVEMRSNRIAFPVLLFDQL
jgi:hypothetical protein